MTLTKSEKEALEDSPAGKNGRYGGISPYNDKDVEEASNYLDYMGYDISASVGGRSVAHILAEFAGHQTKDLRNEALVLRTNNPLVNPATFKWRDRAEKAEKQLATARRLIKSGATLTMADLGPVTADIVDLETNRRIKDA